MARRKKHRSKYQKIENAMVILMAFITLAAIVVAIIPLFTGGY
ncbi:DUF4044 domain-containing protein [Lactobacillus corticis]|uniref:DUF4044 domain-containing protein n=1 Tax=Lactobacillus corticis TaxID=2201249 RepID=A0A916QI24_9LACO|nr:DUF4044 domain-containing protein [Lactobacillus corticis]GFZ27724.1 hypothetical protein LCB40_16040 [Lactobacillus corticis]